MSKKLIEFNCASVPKLFSKLRKALELRARIVRNLGLYDLEGGGYVRYGGYIDSCGLSYEDLEYYVEKFLPEGFRYQIRSEYNGGCEDAVFVVVYKM